MNRQVNTLMIIGLIVLMACTQNKSPQMSEVEIWKLGWRMIASSMDENYELASLQFDSLRNKVEIIDIKFLASGLEAKNEIGKTEEIVEILSSQDKDILDEICGKQFLSDFEPCIEHSGETIDNKALQLELIKMYIDDQVARGNLMQKIIDKYDIDTSLISHDGIAVVDERNRNRLKEVFEEHGFPTRKLVGKDAMQGIFIMIQHSDRDQEWQKSQLPNIERAVKNGDLDGQSYAYLYDRIKINNGEKQLYGTQFSRVDPINKTVELAETEDIENLNKRRMEIGMMPIELYKKFMLQNL